MKDRLAKVCAGGVHAKIAGQGQAVVLISGLGGLASFWSPVAERLSENYRVISFDHPGVGESETVAEQHIENIATAALAILDELGISRAHIVGHSTGSLVAQAFGLDFAERTNSVVLSSGWGIADQRFNDLFQLRKTVLQTLGYAQYRMLGNLLAYPSKEYNEMEFPPPKEKSALATLMAERIDMLLSYSRFTSLGEIASPVLVIGAEDDWIVPYHHSVELATAIPQAQLREFSGGHFAPQVRPQGYARLLDEFFTGAT
ncbi:alpha/beta fold hydrolase [Halomonas sp. V046]|uniref:alpha/beta fold hydrolase n=1 Tax=Halomonas sp. V046 TaxID=3459611 RepID=UPI0040441DB3